MSATACVRASLSRPASLSPVKVEVVVDDVGDGLRVGGRPRAAAVDAVRHLRQLVRHAIRDVRPAITTTRTHYMYHTAISCSNHISSIDHHLKSN